jgi:glycosyltransferase involved in cell wall biosynthesis
VRDDLQRAFPLALTPVGRRPFFRWIFDDGSMLPGVRLETIWWFFLESQEDPARELVQTFLFRPDWQRRFPDGVTVFGRADLATWLAKVYRVHHDWINAASWPIVGTAAQQIRLAYVLRSKWRRACPDAFATVRTADAFLNWLTTPASGLPPDTIAWCKSLDQRTVARELAAGGVNILGHFCYASGLRRSVESVTASMKRSGLGVSLRDIWQDRYDEPRHAEFSGLEFYDTTLIHTQPEPYFEASYLRAGLQPRLPRTYRIGYWYWEFEDIPNSWAAHVAQLDELWVATEFVANAMRQRFDLPVYRLMPGIELPKFATRPRASFRLPENRFVFLFVFSMMSVMERKNPLGLIKAYRQAFGNDDRILLVLKTTFGDLHPELLAQLHAAAADNSIMVIDAVYSQEEILSLLSTADCYISLHRSEGWGLTMAEAMLLGKPTIATGYSGNVDFMTPANSLLVDYELVSLKRDYPPYTSGSQWAEPSIEHAAQLMRRVFENQQWARDLGQAAKEDLGQRLSIESAGRRMAARLDEIQTRKYGRKVCEPV